MSGFAPPRPSAAYEEIRLWAAGILGIAPHLAKKHARENVYLGVKKKLN